MKFQTVRGTRDILPGEVELWQAVESLAREHFELYGFREIRTPIFESTELFARSVGASTDIVRKEMFSFSSGDDSLALRPEMTAPVARAFAQHGLSRIPGTERLFYIGPMFRHERPQRGRQRQFHQVGVETIGSEDPYIDAETIEMLVSFLDRAFLLTAGLDAQSSTAAAMRAAATKGLSLALNSVGCGDCRPGFRGALGDWLARPSPGSSAERLERLCPDCRRRLNENPLRVFDCKVPADRTLLAEAPVLLQHLCGACRSHFEAVQSYLGRMGIHFSIEPRLVRGLDYYVRTAFEIQAEAGLGAQNALMGGGRYDGLLKALGGPDLPGFGWALGLERLLLLLGERSGEQAARPSGGHADLFIVHQGPEAWDRAVLLAMSLRRKGFSVRIDPKARPLAAQLRRASREGSGHALILGDDEIRSATYQLKNMRTEEQKPLRADDEARLIESLTASLDGERSADRGLPTKGENA